VIFVLLACSLIALLAMHQIQNLMSYGATTANYFRAYYLAKAGLDLALTETYLRDVGFQMQVQSGDAIVSGNLLTEYAGFEPYFTVKMESRTTEHTRSLATGESIVIPLFLDTLTSSHKDILTGIKNADLTPFSIEQIKQIKGNAGQKELSFGIFAFSGDTFDEMVIMVMQTGTDLHRFLEDVLSNEEILPADQKNILTSTNTKAYLTIVNTSDEGVEFKISSSQPFALSDTQINVQAHYGDTEVGLEAKFSEPFPNFLQGIVEATGLPTTS
jgi:hypothetical protein